MRRSARELVKNSKSRYLPEELRRRPIARDSLGRPLCRWCDGVVSPPRRSFCSAACVDEWTIRSSGLCLRASVYQRDQGVCAHCGLDTSDLQAYLRQIEDSTKRAELLTAHGLSESRIRSSLWEADHILPVSEGGGCCGLEGLRTLCWKCHQAETSALMRRRSR